MGIYYVSGVPYSSDYLMHFGIKGQKWGIRRYQNPDGTLTDAGKKHYYGDKNANDYDDYYLSMKQREHFNNVTEKEFNSAYKRTAKEDKKRYALEGRPNEIQAAHETAARKIIANRKTVKEKREELYRALKPELQFETNHKLWKKYGYDPDDKSFSTIHDVWDICRIRAWEKVRTLGKNMRRIERAPLKHIIIILTTQLRICLVITGILPLVLQLNGVTNITL